MATADREVWSGRSVGPRYLRQILGYLRKDVRTVVGMHSGTSADGPAVVVVRISGSGPETKAEVIGYDVHEYPSPLRERLLDLSQRENGSADRICQADIAVAEAFVTAAEKTLSRAQMSFADVDLIGSSGQICYQVIKDQQARHDWLSDGQRTAILVVGSGSVIAERSGVTTLSNLRQRDIAAGGYGVPIATYGDWVLGRHTSQGRILQNLGGMSNLTAIPAGGALHDVLAFDVGPGNILIDWVVRLITNGRDHYDRDGQMAAGGAVDPGLLNELMGHPYLVKAPPKETAGGYFGREAASAVLARGTELLLSNVDIVATVTALTAEAAVRAYRSFVEPRMRIDEVLVSGGGAHNPTLVEMLVRRADPLVVRMSDSIGIPVDAREALGIAIMANESIQGVPANVPEATGALHPVICGDISPCGPN